MECGRGIGSVIDLPAIVCDADPDQSAPASVLSMPSCMPHAPRQRPRDDATVVVLKIARTETDGVRRMRVEIPL